MVKNCFSCGLAKCHVRRQNVVDRQRWMKKTRQFCYEKALSISGIRKKKLISSGFQGNTKSEFAELLLHRMVECEQGSERIPSPSTCYPRPSTLDARPKGRLFAGLYRSQGQISQETENKLCCRTEMLEISQGQEPERQTVCKSLRSSFQYLLWPFRVSCRTILFCAGAEPAA